MAHASRILISADLAETLEMVLEEERGKLVRVYERESFLIEDSREVMAESYIASDIPKSLLLCARSYRHEAQNALLKLLEEPPSNVAVILVAPSKSALLATIRSRLPVSIIKRPPKAPPFPIPLRQLSLSEVYGFLKSHTWGSKEDAKQLVESLFASVVELGMKLGERELVLFERAPKLLELNERPQQVFALLLLALLERKKA